MPCLLVLASGCATIKRRAEVVTLASRMLDCPTDAMHAQQAPIDQVCAERAYAEGRMGRCLSWIPLDRPAAEGWVVHGCGAVERFAPHPCDPNAPHVPTEMAFDPSFECSTP